MMILADLQPSSPGILTALIALPVIGAILLCLFRKEQVKQIKTTAIFFSVIVFIASLFLLGTPEQKILVGDQAYSFAAVEHAVLISNPEITWTVGVDGISLWLVLLATFLTPLVLLGSYHTVKKHVREYYIAFLVLETAMIGSLVALDLVVFYVFFELILIPMYLIIGIWGYERRVYAAVKFFIFTVVGSLFLLVAAVVAYFQMGEQASFNLLKMYAYLQVDPTLAWWLFAAFALALAIKVPVIPLHTWLPDAHVQAPTGGSVILAGILLKVGTYGFVRFAIPLFPSAAHEFALAIMILGVISVILAAWFAWAQQDMKSLVAYSSISHLGFCMLGMFAFVLVPATGAGLANTVIGLQGAVFIMVSHGLTAAALFMLVGVIYERRKTRLIDEYGGLAKVMPFYAIAFMIATLGSIGLPGTSGFVGEFTSLMGTFLASGPGVILAILAGLGVIFGAVYMLQLYRRVFFGEVTNPANENLKDMGRTERIFVVPVLVFIMLFGIFPNMMLDRINPSAERVVGIWAERLEATYEIDEEYERPSHWDEFLEANAEYLETRRPTYAGAKEQRKRKLAVEAAAEADVPEDR